MGLRAFSRLTDRVLGRLGQDAIFRGESVVPPVKVALEHAVEMIGAHNDVSVERSVVTMRKELAPKHNDSLVFIDETGAPIAGESYAIDGPPFADNGYTVRAVVRRV